MLANLQRLKEFDSDLWEHTKYGLREYKSLDKLKMTTFIFG